jgi:DNA-binding transcriptional MerR regulator
MSGQRTATQPPRYGVAGAAAKVGVPAATVRTWARRYGIGPRSHQTGAHRRYTAGDVDRLARMVALMSDGVPAAEAARVVRDGAAREAGHTDTGRSAGATVPTQRTVNGAARRLDAARLDDLVRSTLADHGVAVTWERLARPALRSIGNRWQSDGDCIAAEHLLSSVLTAALGSVQPPASSARNAVLLACVPGERHGLPLEVLAAALAERGIAATVLGADMSADAFHGAVRRLAPKASVLYAHSSSDACVGASSELLARSGVAIAAGAGWRRTSLPDAALRVESLADAVAVVEAALR